jgi:hypothetical protein
VLPAFNPLAFAPSEEPQHPAKADDEVALVVVRPAARVHNPAFDSDDDFDDALTQQRANASKQGSASDHGASPFAMMPATASPQVLEQSPPASQQHELRSDLAHSTFTSPSSMAAVPGRSYDMQPPELHLSQHAGRATPHRTLASPELAPDSVPPPEPSPAALQSPDDSLRTNGGADVLHSQGRAASPAATQSPGHTASLGHDSSVLHPPDTSSPAATCSPHSAAQQGRSPEQERPPIACPTPAATSSPGSGVLLADLAVAQRPPDPAASPAASQPAESEALVREDPTTSLSPASPSVAAAHLQLHPTGSEIALQDSHPSLRLVTMDGLVAASGLSAEQPTVGGVSVLADFAAFQPAVHEVPSGTADAIPVHGAAASATQHKAAGEVEADAVPPAKLMAKDALMDASQSAAEQLSSPRASTGDALAGTNLPACLEQMAQQAEDAAQTAAERAHPAHPVLAAVPEKVDAAEGVGAAGTVDAVGEPAHHTQTASTAAEEKARSNEAKRAQKASRAAREAARLQLFAWDKRLAAQPLGVLLLLHCMCCSDTCR